MLRLSWYYSLNLSDFGHQSYLLQMCVSHYSLQDGIHLKLEFAGIRSLVGTTRGPWVGLYY